MIAVIGIVLAGAMAHIFNFKTSRRISELIRVGHIYYNHQVWRQKVKGLKFKSLFPRTFRASAHQSMGRARGSCHRSLES